MATPRRTRASSSAVAASPRTTTAHKNARMTKPHYAPSLSDVDDIVRAELRSAAQIERRHRRLRAVQISFAILSLFVVLELSVGSTRAITQVHEWMNWALELMFPSHDVTSAKVLCLVGGFTLSFYYLVVAGSHRSTSRTAVSSTSSSASVLSPRIAKTPSLAAQNSNSANESRQAAPTSVPLLGPTPLQPAIATELPQLKLVSEESTSGARSTAKSMCVNSKEPIAFENELFKGQLLFLVRNSTGTGANSISNATGMGTNSKRELPRSNWSHLFNGRKRTLWVQVQGQFKRIPPASTTLYVATEIVSPLVVGFWTRKLIDVLAAIMRKTARNVHIAFGGDDAAASDELPHAAFPLYECADEIVETPMNANGSSPSTQRPPMLGIENFGETPQQRDLRMRSSDTTPKSFALDRVYTFQFYTVYADLAQWQIVNVPGLPEIPLKKLVGEQPIRLAAYMAPTPMVVTASAPATSSVNSSSAALQQVVHSSEAKEYLFCFSVHYNEDARRTRGGPNAYPSLIPLQSPSSVSNISSSSSRAVAAVPTVVCSPTASSLRSALFHVDDQQQQALDLDRRSDSDDKSGANDDGDSDDDSALSAETLPKTLVAHEQALRNLKFDLPMWIEQVDRVAGNRKVSYLFNVEESHQPQPSPSQSPHVAAGFCAPVVHRYTVVRSAATIKNALLLLRDTDVDTSEPVRGRSNSSASRSSNSTATSSRSHDDEFRKLLVESREFLYETITTESRALAAALQQIASTTGSDDDIGAAASLALATESATLSRQQHRLDTLKRAMLFHCLKSSGPLPRVRASQDIGIQLTQAKRERMDIICECGVYRVLTPQMLRQEWLMLTTSDVLFFRSYSVRACKTIAIEDVLRVHAVDAPHVLCPQSDDDDDDDRNSADSVANYAAPPRNAAADWHCVELHLMCEIVTVFVASSTARQQFVASLNQIALLRGKPGGCVSPPRTFETQALPLCLNHRNVLTRFGASGSLHSGSNVSANTGAGMNCASSTSPLVLVQDALRKGIAVYEMDARDRRVEDVLAFLDAVEQLADMVLPDSHDTVVVLPVTTTTAINASHVDSLGSSAAIMAPSAALPFSHPEKLAFALNLYHVLFIHATLVFGAPSTAFEWKKMQSVPCYVLGHAPHVQMRVTLGVIERELLRVNNGASSSMTTGSSRLGASSSARKFLALAKSSSVSSSSAGGTSGAASAGDVSAVPLPPAHLAIPHADFRTTFALQMNCSPGTYVMRAYDATPQIHEQLNAVCTLFLARELRADVVERVIALPRVIEWRQQDFLPRSSRNNAGANNSAGGSRTKGSAVAGLSMATGIGANNDARTFYCLQKLLGFLEETQRDRVQHLLLGADKHAKIIYDAFWTQQSSSNNAAAVAAAAAAARPSRSSSADQSAQTSTSPFSRSNPTQSNASIVGPSTSSSALAASTVLSPTSASTAPRSTARQFLQSFF